MTRKHGSLTILPGSSTDIIGRAGAAKLQEMWGQPVVAENRTGAGGSLLPEVPTIAEQGVAGFDYTLWVGLWGSAKLPAELVNKINADVRKALGSADLKDRLTRLGTMPMDMSPQQFTEFVRKEIEDTAKVMKAAGIKPQ